MIIILNTSAAWRLYAWCLHGHHVVRSGNKPEILKEVRKHLKHHGCPKCGARWMSFEIRKET
jgi:hypothetical protein